MQILLVEDDAMLGQAIQLGLSDREFEVTWVRTGAAAISELNQADYAAMILDLGLPDLEGTRVLTSARRRGIVLPILILTARDQAHEKVAHLDSGADDYMTKPFDMNELAARLRALIRRQLGHASATLTVGPITVDTNAREVHVADQLLQLSRREYELLRTLMLSPDRVHTRDRLEAAVFNGESEVESNALEVHISNLRKKLGHKDWIETIRGVGYRLRCAS